MGIHSKDYSKQYEMFPVQTWRNWTGVIAIVLFLILAGMGVAFADHKRAHAVLYVDKQTKLAASWTGCFERESIDKIVAEHAANGFQDASKIMLDLLERGACTQGTSRITIREVYAEKHLAFPDGIRKFYIIRFEALGMEMYGTVRDVVIYEDVSL